MFYYYGSKRRLAGAYDAPLYPTIIEPFAGSAGYSIEHLDAVENVILIEKDSRVVELWQRMLSMTEKDFDDIIVPKAGEKTSDFLFMTAATSNAVAHCNTMTVTSRMPRVIEIMLGRMRPLLPKIREKVTIIQGDYTDAPDIEATWFIDPPYQVVESQGKTAHPKGMGYRRGCNANNLDFAALGKWCKELWGQTIVCEMSTATWLPFKPLRSTHNSLGRPSEEVVWTGLVMPPLLAAI